MKTILIKKFNLNKNHKYKRDYYKKWKEPKIQYKNEMQKKAIKI